MKLSQYHVGPLLFWCDVTLSVHLTHAVSLSPVPTVHWVLVWHIFLNFHYISTALQGGVSHVLTFKKTKTNKQSLDSGS
jgi:hypothetical protein